MSFAVDVNVLLYASDGASRYHAPAVAFLKAHASGVEIMYVSYATLASYLRIATHPRIFKTPLPPAQALDNIQNLARLRNVRLIAEEEGFLDVYHQVTSTLPVRGNLVADATLAALLLQHGINVICTNDADFRKFPFLTVRNHSSRTWYPNTRDFKAPCETLGASWHPDNTDGFSYDVCCLDFSADTYKEGMPGTQLLSVRIWTDADSVAKGGEVCLATNATHTGVEGKSLTDTQWLFAEFDRDGHLKPDTVMEQLSAPARD